MVKGSSFLGPPGSGSQLGFAWKSITELVSNHFVFHVHQIYNNTGPSFESKLSVNIKRMLGTLPSLQTPWFSRQMSHSDYSSDGEYATAIAAAAYAIKSLEEEEEQAAESFGFKNSVKQSDELQNKNKNKRKESFSKRNDSKNILRWFSGKESIPDGLPAGDNSLKNPSMSGKKSREEITWERKISEEKLPENINIKKTARFSDEYPRKMDSRKYKDDKGGSSSSLPMKPQVPYTPFPAKPTSKPVASNWNNQIAPEKFSIEADAWAKAEMEKIRKKYKKMNSTILEWENQKKTKAERRLDHKEREVERRARARQEYRNELMRIDKIAGGARALAEERRRNDEAKIIEKANKIRATGRLPRRCSCF